jgi:hypothetical protein
VSRDYGGTLPVCSQGSESTYVAQATNLEGSSREWDAAYGAREVESAVSAQEAHQFAMAFIRSAILIVAKLEKVSDTA